jgi:IS30 family transposase
MLIAFSPARDATMKTYKQLTYEQRCQIYALNKTGRRGYRIKQAQQLADQRKLEASKAFKMTTSLIEFIDYKIKMESRANCRLYP